MSVSSNEKFSLQNMFSTNQCSEKSFSVDSHLIRGCVWERLLLVRKRRWRGNGLKVSSSRKLSRGSKIRISTETQLNLLLFLPFPVPIPTVPTPLVRSRLSSRRKWKYQTSHYFSDWFTYNQSLNQNHSLFSVFHHLFNLFSLLFTRKNYFQG